MWDAKTNPRLFPVRTLETLAQVPLRLVKVKVKLSDECVKPSKLSIVRLKFPHPSTLPFGNKLTLKGAPDENPVPLFDPEIPLTENEDAFTLAAAVDPSPIR